ncbi:permease prefix domain 1-containing protein [Erysipelothrix anatis]|uniref:permease prefix domain 1-containing protein n=1 Tax=Erysipelothrix anatis TaxID=2683713 RepID=UPI0013577F60|nr:permease prefix domain 1-containing protein [Erysipelothrix anatis]
MRRYQTFLDALIGEIKDPFIKKTIRAEYTAHLDEHYEELLAQGIPAKDAEAAAIASMGDPYTIGRDLNEVHKPLFNWIYLVSKVILVVSILGFLVLFGPTMWQRVTTFQFSKNSITDDLRGLNLVYYQSIDQEVVIGNTVYTFQDFAYTKDGYTIISIKQDSLNDRDPFGGNLFAYNFETTINGSIFDTNATNFNIVSGIPDEGLFYVFGNNPTYSSSWKSHVLLVYRYLPEEPKDITIKVQTLDGTMRQIQIIKEG